MVSRFEEHFDDGSKQLNGYNSGLMDFSYDASEGICKPSPSDGVTGYEYASNASGLMSALNHQPVSVVIQANQTIFQINKRLSALVQFQRGSDDSFMGATGIIEDLVKLREKSENESTDSRKVTCSAKHNFDMSAQYLRDSQSADAACSAAEQAAIQKTSASDKCGHTLSEEEEALHAQPVTVSMMLTQKHCALPPCSSCLPLLYPC